MEVSKLPIMQDCEHLSTAYDYETSEIICIDCGVVVEDNVDIESDVPHRYNWRYKPGSKMGNRIWGKGG